jgi:hypothetical protein
MSEFPKFRERTDIPTSESSIPIPTSKIKKWVTKDRVVGTVIMIFGVLIIVLSIWYFSISKKSECPPCRPGGLSVSQGTDTSGTKSAKGGEVFLAVCLILLGLGVGGLGGGLALGEGIGMLLR